MRLEYAMLLWIVLAPSVRCTHAADPKAFVGEGLCQFRLHDYILPAKIASAINREVAKTLAEHERVFGFKARPEFRVRIRIFGRYADYEQYALTNRDAHLIAQHAPSLTNLSGYYSHRVREVVTWSQNQPGYLANNLLHEASHAILLAHFQRVPPWVSEGGATYFAYPSHMQDAHDIGSLKYRWAKLVLWERRGQLPALATFLDLDDAGWHHLDPVLAYAVSWSLFQHLMSTEPKKRILQALMRDLQPGTGSELGSAGLLASLHPGGLERFERDWHFWIQRGGSRMLGRNLEEILERVK